MMIERSTGQIHLWSDQRAIAPVSNPISEGSAKECATEWILAAGYEPEDQVIVKKAGIGERDFLVSYRDCPFGYPVLSGNHTDVLVESAFRKVRAVWRSYGYTYDPPIIEVSEADAIAALVRRVRDVYHIQLDEAQILGMGYGMDGKRPGELADGDLPQLHLRKRSRLVYQVEGIGQNDGRPTVFACLVDAETGKVLFGGMSKSTRLTPPAMGKKTNLVKGPALQKAGELPVPPPPTKVNPAWLGPASLGGFAAILAAALVGKWIQSRAA